jgi:PAS domain S-box-containing protein
VLNEAVRVTTETLEAESAAVLQALPGRDETVLRAGIGWNDALGLSGAMQARIGVWGVLAVRSTRPESFTGADLDFLQSVANVVALYITVGKQAETALADLQATFVKVFQVCPVPLAISTVNEGRIVDVNDSWLQMYGFQRDELIGRTNAELRLSVDLGARAESVRKIQAAGLVRNLEVQVRAKSGEIRDVIVSAASVVLTGNEEWVLSAQIDVTESKRAQVERDRHLEGEQAARAAAESALERLRGIESITDIALDNLDLDNLLETLLERVAGALDANYASVALIDEERQEVYIRAAFTRDRPAPHAIRAPLGHGVGGKIAVDGVPRIVHDLREFDVSRVTGTTPEELYSLSRSVIGAPLQHGSKIVGVVSAASPQQHHFNEENLKLLRVVADRVAPAIERARLLETIHAGHERLKALSARLLTVQEEERRRLAVELHDELGQVLTAVKIHLQSLERKLDEQFRSDLAEAVDSVDEAVERVRDLALDLRPAVLDDLGLRTALRWYTHRFARDTGIEVHFTVDTAPRLQPALETAFFRVVQEALTNVVRHARARHVWVDLHAEAGETLLTVRDDGVGFDVAAVRERAVGGVSVGLLGMEERVSLLGGKFEVHSVPGEGTGLLVRFSSM